MLFTRSAILALAALSLLCLAVPSRADINGFNSGTGFTANSPTAGLPAVSGGAATITLSTGPDNDSLFYNTPQNITQWTAAFTYQANGSGDGFAFVLQNDPRGSAALGDGGGYLGYSSASVTAGNTITNSAAVEFNLYTPYGTGTRLGTDGITGVFGNNGGYQSTGALSLGSGDPINVLLTYDGTTLSESLTDPTALTSYSTSYAVNLANVVGGSTAYVGFTGGQASARSTQTLTNFRFTNAAPVPEASTPAGLALLLALGLTGMGIKRAQATRRPKTGASA